MLDAQDSDPAESKGCHSENALFFSYVVLFLGRQNPRCKSCISGYALKVSGVSEKGAVSLNPGLRAS